MGPRPCGGGRKGDETVRGAAGGAGAAHGPTARYTLVLPIMMFRISTSVGFMPTRPT